MSYIDNVYDAEISAAEEVFERRRTEAEFLKQRMIEVSGNAKVINELPGTKVTYRFPKRKSSYTLPIGGSSSWRLEMEQDKIHLMFDNDKTHISFDTRTNVFGDVTHNEDKDKIFCNGILVEREGNSYLGKDILNFGHYRVKYSRTKVCNDLHFNRFTTLTSGNECGFFGKKDIFISNGCVFIWEDRLYYYNRYMKIVDATTGKNVCFGKGIPIGLYCGGDFLCTYNRHTNSLVILKK